MQKSTTVLTSLILAFTALPSLAQSDMTAVERYKHYHYALYAEQTCGDLELTQDQAALIERRIDHLVGTDLDAGTSLNAITEAKEEFNSATGCARDEVKAAQAVYQMELSGALE